MAASPFIVPDWTAPLDLDAYLAAIPPEATTKGMFFEAPRRAAQERSGGAPGRDYYAPFTDYPMPEYVEVVVRCAELAYPGEPVRQGLRQFGRMVYPVFFRSLIGRVLFRFAGNDVHAALRVVPRAYKLVTPISEVEIPEQGQGYAIVALRNLWDVPEATQVGIFEGGLESFGHQGEVRVRQYSLADLDLKLTW